jgi:amino acid adenylation domain-containing protein
MHQHIVQAIQGNARGAPHSIALSDTRCSMTYGDLDAFSTRVAIRLIETGCRPGDRVVMLANRGAITVAAILGVFKAGCIHVPLDPHMPRERLQYILTDIEPALIITEQRLFDHSDDSFPPDINLLLTDELEDLLMDLQLTNEIDHEREGDASMQLPILEERDVAYCIYTSGSTGRPKGVLIDHRSIADFFDGTEDVYDVSADSKCVSFSPLHFDVYLMDMLFPLARGAHLRLHDDVVTPDLLLETLCTHGVTHFSAWGAMLGLIAQSVNFGAAPFPHLKTILSGADVPDIKTVQRWLGKKPGVQVINAYGPTEVTCASTAYVIRDLEPDRDTLYPIGKPLKHVRVMLVDEQNGLIESAGVSGELMIGGTQVMKAYWNLPNETAARLTDRDGNRFYRTGDICVYLDDGNLSFLGRKDNEIKIDGYRVHLNEIQRIINSVPKVHASEIVLLESRYGEKLLAACILFDNDRDLQVDQQVDMIKHRLARQLPAYMVPRHVTVFDQFPRLSSGKTDRKALLSMLQNRIN